MDGFVERACHGHTGPLPPLAPNCSVDPKHPDMMGYHDAREIPNYWDYAHHSCCRTTCSPRTWAGACPATWPWCRAGRRSARADRPDGLQLRRQT